MVFEFSDNAVVTWLLVKTSVASSRYPLPPFLHYVDARSPPTDQ